MSGDAARAAPLVYRITVAGKLDVRWAGWFDGFTLTAQESATTLSGAVLDQAQLHGLLDKVLALGLTLVSVEALQPPLEPCPSAH